MSVWWLAINAKQGHCFYRDLKERAVIAQGWPDIGDVGYVRRMPHSHVEDELRRKLNEAYGDVKESLPAKLSAFLCRIRPGDFVVGIEGTLVKGICKLPDRIEYRYDPVWNYAHGLGPVEWVDWAEFSRDWIPVAPAQSVLAVAGMVQSADHVERLARTYWP